LDLVATDGAFGRNPSVTVFLNNGDGTFTPQPDLAVGNGPVSVALGDLNQDGHLDLVTANNNDNTISVVLATATAPSAPGPIMPWVRTRSSWPWATWTATAPSISSPRTATTPSRSCWARATAASARRQTTTSGILPPPWPLPI